MGGCEYSMADYEEDWGIHDEGEDDFRACPKCSRPMGYDDTFSPSGEPDYWCCFCYCSMLIGGEA